MVARVGLTAYGVVHLLIGWLAAQIAWGVGASKSADLAGALRTLADQPFGKFLLCLVAVGLMALALWQASEAIWGYRNVKAPTGPVREQVSGCQGHYLRRAEHHHCRLRRARLGIVRSLYDVARRCMEDSSAT